MRLTSHLVARAAAAAALLALVAAAMLPRDAATPARAVGLPPAVNEPVVATLVAGPLTLTGTNLGLAVSTRSIRFDFSAQTVTVDASSPLVQQWDNTNIKLTLPPQVHSGQLTVIVDGQSSNAVPIFVYEMTETSTSSATNTFALPLAVATAADGTPWVLDEFHTELKSFSTGQAPILTAIPVPQIGGAGIFVNNSGGADSQTRVSSIGEDVVVAGDGTVWFAQGGAYLYGGAKLNSSRIVQYRPATASFACYNLPINDSEVAGVLLDPARGMVWYAEASLSHGNAITGFHLDAATPDCNWDPATGARPPICTIVPVPGCHQRFTLPHPSSSPVHLTLDSSGNIWFSEVWGNRLGEIDPDTGALTELPLPAPIVRQGPGAVVGSAPWSMVFDGNGDLWTVEQFDATVERIRPSLMLTNDCTRLDTLGHNPCVTEMFVGTNGFDGNTAHSATVGADGFIWFTLSAQPTGILSTVATAPQGNVSRVGFVAPAFNNAVVLLPPIIGVNQLAGIAQSGPSHDVWFSEYTPKKLARLKLASGDADGVPDAVDNCPSDYNPTQANADGELINLSAFGKAFNDATWPNSDAAGDACDSDADNDGFSNADEAALGPGHASHALCPSASADTNPLKLDTDGDGVTDGAECALGTDPASSASVPPRSYPASVDADHDGLPDALETQIGTNPNSADSDGDGVLDGVEVKLYGTNPLVADTDGDGCGDGKEIASINGDRQVSSADLAQVAQAFGPSNSSKYVPDFDMNRDGSIAASDLGFVARQFGHC